MIILEKFVRGCICSIIPSAGERVPRPLSTALSGKRPNEVVHIDVLFLGYAKDSDEKYVLVMKENLTVYSWLIPYSNPDREAAIEGISRWIASF